MMIQPMMKRSCNDPQVVDRNGAETIKHSVATSGKLRENGLRADLADP